MIGPGAKLGRYELRESIGVGGMSAVYLGYDPMLDREIAVKVLPPELACKETYRQRFIEEARALGRVDHPNLVRIFAVGQEGRVSYYAMELVRGCSLADAIRAAKRLTLAEAMAVFAQFLQGLKAIHDAGIVHRDIKPGNIMLSEAGRVILMDFGLARRADRQSITVAGSVLGTPEYMAPEQAKGDPADARSDLYAAGVVLFEMLSGAAPYLGKDTLAILRQHVESPTPSIRAVASETPSRLEAMLNALLAKQPDRRPQSVEVLLAELRPFLPDERQSERIIRALVARAHTTADSAAPASTGGVAPPSSAVAGRSASSRATSSVAVASPAWVPWGAMATALLAVLVAVLALFRPPAPPAYRMRTVTLRNGDRFSGILLEVQRRPHGEQMWVYRTPDGATRRLSAADLSTDVKDPVRSWLQVGAALVAAVALCVAIVVFLQTWRASRGGRPQSRATPQSGAAP